MMNLEINTVISFQPAVWWHAFSLKLFENPQHNLLVNDYFIATAQDQLLLCDAVYCYQVKSSDYLSINDALLVKNKLLLGRLINKKVKEKIQTPIHSSAWQLIIQLEVAELYPALCGIYKHLKERFSEQKMITEHGAVQNLFSQIIEQLSTLKMLVKNLVDPEPEIKSCFLNYAKKLISSTCLDLAKLQGGQGFLYGGLIEMAWFFQLVNALYLI